MVATRGDVPCNGCTACCSTNELIVIRPEDGDVPLDYDTQIVIHPLTGKKVFALRHKPEGGCVYLEEDGCSIHGHQPATCREFDCRYLYLDFLKITTRKERRKIMRKQGLLSKQIFREARKRLNTLQTKEGENQWQQQQPDCSPRQGVRAI